MPSLCVRSTTGIAKRLHEERKLALGRMAHTRYIGSINCSNGPLQDQGRSTVARHWRPTGSWTVLEKPASAGFLLPAIRQMPSAPQQLGQSAKRFDQMLFSEGISCARAAHSTDYTRVQDRAGRAGMGNNYCGCGANGSRRTKHGTHSGG